MCLTMLEKISILLDERLDKVGLDKVGVDKMGCGKGAEKLEVLDFQTNEENSTVNTSVGFACKYEPF